MIFFILTLFVGIGFFIYPDVASWWNGRIQHGLMDTYQVDVAQMERDLIDTQFQHARAFNESINEINISDPFADTETLPEDYMRTLNVRGVMATVEIPVINVTLPVFHGTSSAVLDRGAGHLKGTSFPIGGEGTHAVITAHSGLSNARMFTDMLDNNLYIGDYFFINVLDQRLAYRVIQIDTVTPDNVDLIRLYPGEDFVTLITCTPLVLNTHRLLVRGTRVPYIQYMAEEIVPVITLVDTNWRLLATFAAFGLFLFVFVGYQLVRIFLGWRRKRKGLLPVGAVAQTLAYESDDYVNIPETARYVNPAYIEARRQRARSRKKADKDIKRRLAMGMGIFILVAGAGIMLFPQVQRLLYDRYAENLIIEFQEAREEAAHFITQRWMNHTVAFVSDISNMPIGSTNGGIGQNGDINIGNIPLDYSSQLSVNHDGYLTLGGIPVGSNGYITLSDVVVATNGAMQPADNTNLFIGANGSYYVNIGGDLFLGTNGGNLSMGNLHLGPDGNIYIGGINIGNLVNGDFCLDDHDLDFIFNFDPNQDPLQWLNDQMQDHNYTLYETDQSALTHLEAAEEVYFSVTEVAGIRDEMLGFITIEYINIQIPIFAGSSDGNMNRGAAHMTHTSLPVGGISTNSVITAHRGLTRARMFRDIYDLPIGTIITITNIYQTLTYAVTGQEIVNDVLVLEDMDRIRIREGVDMITLLTCHPYRVNSCRLLVFAERVPD